MVQQKNTIRKSKKHKADRRHPKELIEKYIFLVNLVHGLDFGDSL